ncbi:MAG: DUF4249 domain-containing protein [Cyclobacteriaceae bacterium]
MKFNQLYLWLLLVSVISSCQEIVDIELPVEDPRLVIDGHVYYWPDQPEKNEARVVVSTSGNYYDEDTFNPVNNAQVEIEDVVSGQIYELPPLEDEPGTYLNTSLPIDSGRTYRLHLAYGNEQYEASGTVLPIAQLDSFSYKYREASLLLDSGYYFFFSGRTPKERGINYYRFKIYENDSLYDQPEDYLIQSDELLRAQIDTLQLANYAFELGDTVRIEMYSLNKDVFDYYNELLELLFNDGGLFSSPPRNPDSNIVNVTDPLRAPLGFFQVSSVLSGGAIVEEKER